MQSSIELSGIEVSLVNVMNRERILKDYITMVSPFYDFVLFKKIEGYSSKYEAAKLDRQVNVAGRVKTMNERIYYSVYAIHEAINDNKQITFQYFVWTVDKMTNTDVVNEKKTWKS